MGAAAALAGVMLTGKLNAIQATSAPYFNLHVIAAVVVGGTSLFGGRASMIGSLAGVLLLSMMINALVTLRIEFFWPIRRFGCGDRQLGRSVHLDAKEKTGMVRMVCWLRCAAKKPKSLSDFSRADRRPDPVAGPWGGTGNRACAKWLRQQKAVAPGGRSPGTPARPHLSRKGGLTVKQLNKALLTTSRVLPVCRCGFC